jgi:hypothetical protein
MLRILLAAFTLLLPAALLFSAEKEKPKADSFIKLTAKGKLETGIVAVGGETTGIVLTTKDGALELDIKDKELLKKADSLNGKVVIITGTLAIKPGVEVKIRHIVTVDSIKAEDEK